MGPAEQKDLFDLRALLSPIAAEEFLRRDFGQRFVHVPGYPGKFSALLPWPVLNRKTPRSRLTTLPV